MKSRTPLRVELLRGNMVESVHEVMAVVVDDRGLVVGYWGNGDYLIFPRSSIKPIQAVAFAESGAMEKFGLDDRHLALACSSHRGEKGHLQLAGEWLEKLKIVESVLHCGPAMPAHQPTEYDMVKKGIAPHPLVHNCSGKHLGIISTCLALNENPMGYAKHDHPAQARLRKVMGDMMKVNFDKMPYGIDGCGIPTYATPLHAVATAMAMLNRPAANNMRKMTFGKIVDACKAHPFLLSGSDEFATVVNEKTVGKTVMKTGAEGVYTGLLTDKGYAFALKVVDGNTRAAAAAAAYLAQSWGGITDAEWKDLKKWVQPEIKNSRGEKVGEIRVVKGL